MGECLCPAEAPFPTCARNVKWDGADQTHPTPTSPRWLAPPVWCLLGACMLWCDCTGCPTSAVQTLVVNVLMAPLILKERLTKLDLVATAVIVAGTVLSVAFGSKESVEHDIHERACCASVCVVHLCVCVRAHTPVGVVVGGVSWAGRVS